jgi:hypothetical protein
MALDVLPGGVSSGFNGYGGMSLHCFGASTKKGTVLVPAKWAQYGLLLAKP